MSSSGVGVTERVTGQNPRRGRALPDPGPAHAAATRQRQGVCEGDGEAGEGELEEARAPGEPAPARWLCDPPGVNARWLFDPPGVNARPEPGDRFEQASRPALQPPAFGALAAASPHSLDLGSAADSAVGDEEVELAAAYLANLHGGSTSSQATTNPSSTNSNSPTASTATSGRSQSGTSSARDATAADPSDPSMLSDLLAQADKVRRLKRGLAQARSSSTSTSISSRGEVGDGADNHSQAFVTPVGSVSVSVSVSVSGSGQATSPVLPRADGPAEELEVGALTSHVLPRTRNTHAGVHMRRTKSIRTLFS